MLEVNLKKISTCYQGRQPTVERRALQEENGNPGLASKIRSIGLCGTWAVM